MGGASFFIGLLWFNAVSATEAIFTARTCSTKDLGAVSLRQYKLMPHISSETRVPRICCHCLIGIYKGFGLVN